MILGGLADGSGFSASEIGAMTKDQAVTWWNCIMSFRQEVQKQSE